MKKQIPSFVSGMLTMALIGSLSVGALAATGHMTIEVDPINVQVNGQVFAPKDANGNAVPVFTYNGTTYAPLRALAESFGLEVGYDSTANMATVSQPGRTADVPVDNQGQAASIPQSGSVLVDKNGIKITFMGFAEKTDGLLGYDIKVKIENTSSKNYTVQVRDLSINDVMITTSVFSANVASGKTSNDAIWVYSLEDAGVTLPIKKAEFYLHIFNADDWHDSFDSDVVTVQ